MDWFCRLKIDILSTTEANRLSAGWTDSLYITDRRWGLMQMQVFKRMQHPVPGSVAASCARCSPHKGDMQGGNAAFLFLTPFFLMKMLKE